MTLPSLQDSEIEVDRLAPAHPVAGLQDLRKTLHGLGPVVQRARSAPPFPPGATGCVLGLSL